MRLASNGSDLVSIMPASRLSAITLGVDAVALRARLVGDPGKYHRLARLELDAAREGGELADLDVVCHPFAVIQRAMLAPDLAGLLRHAAVGGKVLLRHRDDKSIDVRV